MESRYFSAFNSVLQIQDGTWMNKLRLPWKLAGTAPFATSADNISSVAQTVCDHGAKAIVTAPKLHQNQWSYENHTPNPDRSLWPNPLFNMAASQSQGVYAEKNSKTNWMPDFLEVCDRGCFTDASIATLESAICEYLWWRFCPVSSNHLQIRIDVFASDLLFFPLHC